jgi:hypothetical protein
MIPGAPDLYPIQTAAEEEQSAKESVYCIKPIGNSLDSVTDLLSNK